MERGGGDPLGRHEGGYDPFQFDVTEVVKPSGNRLTVRVHDDPGEAKPRGKQSPVRYPEGCTYMRVTGIWQTVWLEGVGRTFVRDWTLRTHPETGGLEIRAACDGPTAGLHFQVCVRREGKELRDLERLWPPRKSNSPSSCRMWSPGHRKSPCSMTWSSWYRAGTAKRWIAWQVTLGFRRIETRDVNHPCIITWVPTNEQTSPEDDRVNRIKVRLYEATKALDPTRPVVDTSGYCHTKTDIVDLHVNPPDGKTCRQWWETWRRSIAASGNFPAYPNRPAYAKGFRHQGQPVVIELYVQLYDVEGEVNGYLTYDRKPKVPPEVIREIHAEGLRKRLH